MQSLVAAVILTLCPVDSDHCHVEIAHLWRGPTIQDLHQCAGHAESLLLEGKEAICEVAFAHSLGEPEESASIPEADPYTRRALAGTL